MAKQEVNVGGNVSVGGHFVVADSIKESFNALPQSAAPDVKELVRRLGEAVVEMCKTLPQEKQQEAAQDFKTLTEEAAKTSPILRYTKVAGQGLIDLAKTAAHTAVPVLVADLLKHWGVS